MRRRVREVRSVQCWLLRQGSGCVCKNAQKKGQCLSKMGGLEHQRFMECVGVIRVVSEGAGEAMD